MYARVKYLDNQQSLSMNDASNQDPLAQPPFFMRANGTLYNHFAVESSRCSEYFTDPNYGPGRKLTITGREGVIKQTLVLEMYDRYPDVVLVQSQYLNEGETPLSINDIYCQYYRLNRKLTNPAELSYKFRHTKPIQDSWGHSYLNLPITNDYSEEFQVPLGGYGRSGVPFIDVWGQELGMAIFMVESVPRIMRILCRVQSDWKVDISIHIRPSDTQGQVPERLPAGQEITTWKTAVCVHKGDFFNPARRFAQVLDGALQKAGKRGFIAEYPPQTYQPYWKTWGMNSKQGSGDFTLDQVSARMDELADAGFHSIMLDDGWYDTVGQWNLDPEKFPRGDSDMVAFVKDCHSSRWGKHDASFQVYLWWDPLGSKTAEGSLSDLLVQNPEGEYFTGGQAGYMLCPAYEETIHYLTDVLLNRFYNTWGVDGVYHDWTDQNAPACYAPSHQHADPRESIEKNYEPFRAMHEYIRQQRPDSYWDSQCNCAAMHDIYQYPYYYFEDTSDPTTDRQVRYRLKWIKALRGSRAPVGDGYVDDMSYNHLSGEPAQSVAIGSVITSLRWKVDELGGQEHAQQWMDLYYSEKLSDGEFLNLYDVYYDSPEGYVIRKNNGILYYFFVQSDSSYSGDVELRGLQSNTRYKVTDYELQKSYGEISGKDPALKITLKPGNNEDGKIFYQVLKCVPEKM